MVPGEQAATSGRPATPGQAWAALRDGNARFVGGTAQHPNQDAGRRSQLASGQRPFATLFGCSDSRVAAEVIFDQGLGDLFVIRTAGHVAGPTELGSLEFGAEVLRTPLIAVLGHDSCGAVSATMEAFASGVMPAGFMRDLAERVTPSVTAAYRKGARSTYEVEAEHVRQTAGLIAERSRLIARRIEQGSLAIVGLMYELAEGQARVVRVAGQINGLDDPAW